MACGLLQPAPAGAAALWPCFLPPAPRRSFPKEEQLNQFQRWKLPLSATRSQRSRSHVGCSCSGSSEGVAAVSRPADAPTAQSAVSMTCWVDLDPGAPIVIFGYWTGPDVDDGCGSVEAMLQRMIMVNQETVAV
ncbi:uncharacterized protein LOC110432816 isoform X3 [Sorghum bicolor]|uniref:uncharacterized protein LOC110432816 isoform X3 n=1 Tax=Sorghum bicolor TaxID=4558 RepID=UPI000B424AF6|nr:uncharacterized protein LOC110432816 isoform X3 [Sorghum bicolor]|eukprot:XP_021309348.1 uncharacterized protein LOC110432816 isoform X3 [Sorghum bicolor]